jgi:hypothetical protein
MQKAVMVFLLAATSCTAAGKSSEEQVRDMLRLDLYDADSARFQKVQNIASTSTQEAGLICGYVNAKNRFGAYSGFHQFIAYPSQNMVLVDPDVGSGPDQRAFNAARRKASKSGCKFWF